MTTPTTPEPSDPLDTPLPCDVRCGSMTFRAGVRLRTLVNAAARWNEQLVEIERARLRSAGADLATQIEAALKSAEPHDPRMDNPIVDALRRMQVAHEAREPEAGEEAVALEMFRAVHPDALGAPEPRSWRRWRALARWHIARVRAEREACAGVAETAHDPDAGDLMTDVMATQRIAAAIRARGSSGDAR